MTQTIASLKVKNSIENLTCNSEVDFRDFNERVFGFDYNEVPGRKPVALSKLTPQ
jgi:hypothetical protein